MHANGDYPKRSVGGSQLDTRPKKPASLPQSLTGRLPPRHRGTLNSGRAMMAESSRSRLIVSCPRRFPGSRSLFLADQHRCRLCQRFFFTASCFFQRFLQCFILLLKLLLNCPILRSFFCCHIATYHHFERLDLLAFGLSFENVFSRTYFPKT